MKKPIIAELKESQYSPFFQKVADFALSVGAKPLPIDENTPKYLRISIDGNDEAMKIDESGACGMIQDKTAWKILDFAETVRKEDNVYLYQPGDLKYS